ncbi:lytic transglycosylase [Streptomyces sp. NPDC088725]|uniref:transglycosylase SLT domain-containing protein n=1 Tax=Streptomyces sp. NPDC088725 TaxID=3365873 RepID=UPI0038026C2B
MFASRTPGFRLNKTHKVSIIGATAAVATASLAFSLTPGSSASAEAKPHTTAATAPVAFTTAAGSPAQAAHKSVAKQFTTAEVSSKAHSAAVAKAAKASVAAKAAKKAETAAEAKAKAASAATAQAKAKAAEKAQAVAKAKAAAAAKERAKAKATVSRAAHRAPVYANNLDGWIRESLSIMKKHGIPGSYEGLHRNIIRESSGNPNAINNWDINAKNGIPSKGLLQVIPPTFATYHVAGTSHNIYDPVANIVAACNYAADKYGSMDNVNSAY